MPLYEYKCESCRKIHEVMQKFSDPLLETCPECAGPVEKVMSLSAFALKGSGWYTTDYKRSGTASSGASSSSPSGDGESSSGAGESSEGKKAASSAGTATPATA